MYKNKKNDPQMSLNFEDFFLPFGGKLDGNNRWIKLANVIPWGNFEEQYCKLFSDSMGANALPFRIALGALIIKERLRITDREAVEQIKENPYLQYFLGFSKFTHDEPFDASMYVYFRKRISDEILSQINEAVIDASIAKKKDVASTTEANDDEGPPKNSGKLIIDATCTPADIRYPTDLSLLNEAREKTERIIDVLWEHRNGSCGFKKKPRTYRNRARKDFFNIIKVQKDKNRTCRKGIRKQLNYLKRNLEHIDKLNKFVSLNVLSRFLYRCLLVVNEVYRQQRKMYDNHTHRIADRIVSITQPHVRPIVRGKAGKKVEFGAKISASSCMGYSTVDRISWDAYNESEDLIVQAKKYRKRFGHYPASIHADKIYRNRDNRKWCKKHDIRLSGPPLGRPPKITEQNHKEIKLQKALARQDELDRIDIEGRFGHSKRKYGLGRVMAKLTDTSASVISLVFLVMNLEKILKDLFWLIFYLIRTALSITDAINEVRKGCKINNSNTITAPRILFAGYFVA